MNYITYAKQNKKIGDTLLILWAVHRDMFV